MIVFNFLVGILGLVIGSFLNCVIYRLETGGSFLKGRSFCPHCKHSLNWMDLIPVFSFVFLQGSCRYCGKKISPAYPLVELATSLIFLLIFINRFEGYTFLGISSLLLLLYVASALIVIFMYDLKHFLIPDDVLFPAIIITFFYQLFFNHTFLFFNSLWAALGAAAFFLVIFLVSKGLWMGFGDVKLAILLGLVLGFPNIVLGLFLGFFFGAIIGVTLMAMHKKGLKSELPFAPFLIAGTFIALFWGPQIIDWYMHFLTF